MNKNFYRQCLSSSLIVLMAGCNAVNYEQSQGHITEEKVIAAKPVSPGNIPRLVKSTPTLPAYRNVAGDERFDVVVTNIPAKDLLFALARDAEVNMDVDARVGGIVSLNALDQTLDAILERIADQVAIRIERRGGTILILPDVPYFKRYQVYYPNIVRDVAFGTNSGGLTGVGDTSFTTTSQSDFWNSLELAINGILGLTTIAGDAFDETLRGDDISQGAHAAAQEGEENADPTARTVTIVKETGAVLVYASSAEHEQIESLIEAIQTVSSRQVLLEATVVEVVLNNTYRQGIDWSVFNPGAVTGLAAYQGGTAGAAAAALNQVFETFENELVSTDRTTIDTNGDGFFSQQEVDGWAQRSLGLDLTTSRIRLKEFEPTTEGQHAIYDFTYEITRPVPSQRRGLQPAIARDGFLNLAYRQGDLTAAVQLLDNFGDAKVLSSPRISAINNQPAVLKVVDQEIYFDVTVTENDNTDGVTVDRTFEVQENVIDIGFVMTVIPQIDNNETVVLSLKPSVTRVVGYAVSPVINNVAQTRVPITRVREMESIIKLQNGEIAVLGGLLEDRVTDNDTSIPGLAALPGVGSLFQNKNQSTQKTEFVVFIKANIINEPSIHGDFREYQDLLPDSDFLKRNETGSWFPRDQRKKR